MRRFVAMLGLTGLILVTAVPAMAASPCNGDETGREYAQNHIVELATAGSLGDGGHKPGSHHGYSTCL